MGPGENVEEKKLPKAGAMTEGSISGSLIRFTLPLFIGNLFQQLYNTADALIVGNFLGSEALAAVSATGSLVFLIISFFAGLSGGAGVAISRFIGARDSEKVEQAVHTHVALSLVVAAVLTTFGSYIAPVALRWMGTPADVLPGASEYIRIFFLGSLGTVLYNTFRSIMQAAGDGKNPLKYLIICSVLNVVLDILFITVFHGGVGSAAFATILSQLFSALLCGIRLNRTDENYALRIRKIRIHAKMAGLTVRYGFPSGMQNSVTAISNVLIQTNINSFGTMAVAGCGAYSKIEGFAFLPITSFAIALTTFVGQNLGAREFDRARKGTRFGMLTAVGLAQLVGIVGFLAAPFLIGLFTKEPAAIAYGVQKMRTCTLFYCVLSMSHTLAAVLRGAGKAIVPMISMLLFWCVVRVIIIGVAMPVYHSIAVVNWVYPITWCMCTAFLLIYYLRADWVHSFEKQEK